MSARSPTRFVFVRHGETDWNRRPRFRGHVDVPLNSHGIRQAELVGDRLAALGIAAIYASPLSRTIRTAEAVAVHHELAVIAEPGLIDMDFGAWHGRTPAARPQRTDPGAIRHAGRPPRVGRAIPGGERLADVQRGCSRRSPPWRVAIGPTVVLVSHDIVGRVLACTALGVPLGRALAHPARQCRISIFEHDGRTVSAP